jgi:cell division protein FtsN
MKLDKDTYLLAQDLFIRLVTNPSYEGNDAQTAVSCIRQANAFFAQWDAMQEQVKAAATQAVETAKPAAVQPLPRKPNGEREKLSKAPAKQLRGKVPKAWSKKPAKALKAKRKAKR